MSEHLRPPPAAELFSGANNPEGDGLMGQQPDSGYAPRSAACTHEELEKTRPDLLRAMTEAERTNAEEEAAFSDIPEPPSDGELNRLRELLFNRELSLIERMRLHITGRRYNAKTVSYVIAEAILLRSSRDKGLNSALEPLIDEILKTSLRKHQKDFVNALFPLMGPSIRKSIAETFRSMLGIFSKSMEMAFSWKGLRWRIEAWRTGKSFSEVVLLHTLVYRVEQMFFIHNDTGLVLAHMLNPDMEQEGAQDADMVSAMLTAVQDFARDCFTGGAHGELESLRMGEFNIILERGHQAYLACVVRGTPPDGFLPHLRSTLDLMLVEYALELENFTGDTEPFDGVMRYLSDCMISRFADDDKKLPTWSKVLTAAVLLFLVGWFGYSTYTGRILAAQKMEALAIMRAEPGLMVISVGGGDPPWELITLKDSLTDDPETLLRDNNIDPALFTFKNIPSISYDPAIVLKRAETGLKPLDTVSMEYDGKGTLIFKGTAPMLWIVQAREQARTLPGVESVEMKDLRDPAMDDVFERIKGVESLSIEFPTGADTPVPADRAKLQDAVATLADLEKKAAAMGLSMSLVIYGHADKVGTERRNYEVSLARTRNVAAMLYAKGSRMPISMFAMGSDYPKEQTDGAPAATLSDQASRRIELKVHLTRLAKPDTNLFD